MFIYVIFLQAQVVMDVKTICIEIFINGLLNFSKAKPMCISSCTVDSIFGYEKIVMLDLWRRTVCGPIQRNRKYWTGYALF